MSCALLSTSSRSWSVWDHTWFGALSWRRRKKKIFFLSPPILYFRKAENDLSKVMIKGDVMDGFVLLCLSIFQSFLRWHCFCFLSPGRAIISITHHISTKFTVSLHAQPKGRKSHSVRVKFHFLTSIQCCFFLGRVSVHSVELQCDIFMGSFNIARQWLLLLKFWLRLQLCACISPKTAVW